MSRRQSYKEGEAADFQPANSNRGSKVTKVTRVALLVLCVLLSAALFVIYRLSSQLESPKNNCECEKRNVTAETQSRNRVNPTCTQSPDRKQPCYKCEDGWEQHGGKCYYFSITESSWEESREECRAKGGDLVQIDSWEEQMFLVDKLMSLMREPEDKFWIGLTDSAAEGTWSWVDDSPLVESFWIGGEPDNWTGKTPEGEDCARMGKKGGAPDLRSWYDVPCSDHYRFICEKAKVTGQLKYVCT